MKSTLQQSYNKMNTRTRSVKAKEKIVRSTKSKVVRSAPVMGEHEGPLAYCPYCQMGFKRIAELQNHITFHRREKKFECKTCKKGFSNKKHLASHEKMHKDGKPWKCDTCDKSFMYYATLKDHMDAHKGKYKYKCDHCNKGFNGSASYKIHVRTHTGEKPFECPTCGKGFVTRNVLKSHIMIHTGEKPFSCDQCDMTFRKLGHLRNHEETHTGKMAHKCRECGLTFRRPIGLQTHMLTHSGERPHMCSDCGKGFRTAGSLKYHEQVHQKRFRCPVCSVEFKTLIKMEGHMSTHSGSETETCAKPHVCSDCGDIFETDAALEIHKQTHDRFVCTICSLDFKSITEMKSHMATHSVNNTTTCETFLCTDCSVEFKSITEMRRHMSSHSSNETPKCHICNEAFINDSHLRYHMLRHKEEKLNVCTCGERLSTPNDLKNHMLTHLVDNQHKYPICESSLSPRSSDKNHMSSNHTEDITCSLCQLDFPQAQDLLDHMKTHVDEASCAGMQKCEFATTSNQVLKATVDRPSRSADWNGNQGIRPSAEKAYLSHGDDQTSLVSPNSIGRSSLPIQSGPSAVASAPMPSSPHAQGAESSDQSQALPPAVKCEPTDHLHVCSMCGAVFDDLDQLSGHAKLHDEQLLLIDGCQPVSAEKIPETVRQKSKPTSSEKLKDLACHICGDVFEHVQLLKMHLKYHHDETLPAKLKRKKPVKKTALVNGVSVKE